MTTHGQAATAELTETEQRNLRAVADVLQYWNSGDIDGVLAFYDEAIAWRNVALEQTYHGHAGVRSFLERLYTALPDLHFGVTHKIARGNNVSEQWVMRGTHLGPFLGIPATGRHIVIEGMAIAAYALSPIDLIPDFIPVLGYFDEVIILPVAIAFVIKMIPDSLMAEFREEAQRRSERPVSRMAAAAIMALWISAAGFLLWALWPTPAP